MLEIVEIEKEIPGYEIEEARTEEELTDKILIYAKSLIGTPYVYLAPILKKSSIARALFIMRFIGLILKCRIHRENIKILEKTYRCKMRNPEM